MGKVKIDKELESVLIREDLSAGARLMFYFLHRHGRDAGGRVAAAFSGMSRMQRWRYKKELERKGLIPTQAKGGGDDGRGND